MALTTSQALQVILPVLDALLLADPTLPAATRQQLAALVDEHGPGIVKTNIWDAPARIAAFLEDVARLSASLPAPVSAALAGAGSDGAAPGAAALTRELRRAIFDRLIRLHDFRTFDAPEALAAEVIALVAGHSSRLSEAEQADWGRLRAAHEAAALAAAPFLSAVERLLAGYPAVRQLLESRKRPAPDVTRGPAESLAIAKGALGAAPSPVAAPGPLPAAEVTRYANVNFPNKVLVTQQMVPLVVHLGAQHAAKGIFAAEDARMTLRAGDLTVLLFAEGFEIARSIGGRPGASGLAERIVAVRGGAEDSEPLVFFLNPQSAGLKRITLDFYQGGVRVLSLGFNTEVVADPAALGDLSAAALAPVPVRSPDRDEKLPPPDLELRVILSADQRTLEYILHSPNAEDYHFMRVGSVTLQADPRTALKPLFDRLNTLARQSSQGRTPAQTDAALRELADIGINLYEQLLPPEFKAEYGGIRAKYAGKGLLITSDDPWIPWEVVRPFCADARGEVLYDDPPLCELFRLTRWLAGRGTPDQVRMQQGVWVAPADNLKAAQQETEYFQELHRRNWAIRLDGPLSALAEVDARFRDGGTHLFHFVCHGSFNLDDPNESKLKLAGDFLRPSQIAGQSQAGLRRARPVVFLNACHSGQVGVGLTGLGGWAERFLAAGASAFIGALWEANDVLAAQFAREFYNRLWGLDAFQGRRQPLGQAFHEARMAIKQADPANPTWLAYVLYGDPYGQVTLG